MKRSIFLSVIVLMTTSTNYAEQFPFTGCTGGYRHASTAQEGRLHGMASFTAGHGIYLRSLGKYRIYNEQAKSLYLDNKRKTFDLYWHRKDEWNKRQNAKPKYLDRYEHKLNQAERRHKLKLREQQLIKEGVLPERPEPHFVHNGKKYKTYDEFRGTKDWIRMKQNALVREHKRKLEKQRVEKRHQEAIQFLAWWDKLSHANKQRYSKMSPERKAEFRRGYTDPSYLKKKRDLRFYERHPYLIPKEGQHGLPPLPQMNL